ncbi:putative bifunctional diguanylate cyclase/phosphodiesterase [Trichloromonas sp.]|uniref:putative bifunctional diguanylate cyclase/phosphodiesterase n=1 Tax=Trichloromonas sp. TaxID=3069249 RepID=UPI003D81B99C
MSQFIEVLFDFLTQFTGGRGGIDHNVVQFGLAAIFWAALLAFAWERRREDNPPRERLLICGFSLGLSRELLMLGLAFVQALGWVDHDRLHVIFPPLEHALSNAAIFYVAGAFLLFFLESETLSRRFLRWSLASLLLCYLATFWWWGAYILAHPESKFGQTWCDWLFRINASFWIATAFTLVLRGRRGAVQTVVSLALVLFFLVEFLKIIDMAMGEVHEATFTPIRHGFYLLAIFLLGYIYLREQSADRKKARAAMQELAYYDSLTGLANRSQFLSRLDQLLSEKKRSQTQTALLFLDLDRFKATNDTRGHAYGDLLLVEAARRIRGAIRKEDIAARLGGDEFVVLLGSVSSGNEPLVVAEKLLQLLRRPYTLEGHETLSSASIGVAFFPEDGDDGQALLKHADMAMFAAKEQGRNRYQLFSADMHRQIIEKHQTAEELRLGIKRQELVLHYQPQVDLRSGDLLGVEALVRWQHPAKGLVYPGQFIEAAEETGLIRPMGEWVLRTACAQARAWQQQGVECRKMAVNISAIQFAQPDFLAMIDQVLAETGLSPEYLELELTESVLMVDGEEALRTLDGLKQRGVDVAIDDFGTGYSSLSYLNTFPVDRIKIDRSFVAEITAGGDDHVIIRTILAMASSLNLKVVAEGVETREQYEILGRLNCNAVQGYYVGRPIPSAELMDWLVAWPASVAASARG